MPEVTPGLVRCAGCGAGNPADASWCGQCLARFDASSDAVTAELPRPALSREGEAVHWTCPACEASNPIDAGVCERCGSSFAAFFAPPASPRTARASSRLAVGLSAVLPGLGHWSFGKAPAAVARALLYVWTVGLSVLLLARPPATGRGMARAVGAVFLIAAAGIWVASMLETIRLAGGDERPMLPNHALTWLTAGLSVLLFVGLLGSALAGRGAP